ncbi:bifunctional cobalt-precorrin-7 (C(5))-methyltransferase/cobalt-precorrin-6B (C(15))-methyltransferase [Pseudonocardia petroleophila]|uniref:Precorrin-6y C5,15-methyltransferase (Decarboxylating) subunit CbiE n=1 Tax=Pseudonocardia petroleophila TaxID=37331 RepID=A0A7G7MBA9_9PSEU|nr:precorrin-6y C5,15-methyltransferase (decarboxylating) subunit CbiE [Pseudonocardia petroleophila]QNG50070.1 precorrin-6y C5,15-methyltransferase (decarboxylating) subunit CbiE [Pseudonocardia petroleophila]
MLTVVGIDGGPLPPGAVEALAGAEVVTGAARYLHLAPASAERVEMGPVDAALAALAGRRAVVLASGDPGFFGIVRLLRARGFAPAVLPACSAVQRAFARIGRPWDDVAVVSAHGRALGPAVNLCRAHPAVAVLTAPGAGPAEIGAALHGWDRTLVVAEDLDGPAEQVTTVTPQQAASRSWRDPNVVLCLRDPSAVPEVGWRAGGAPAAGWALPESAFEHRAGMITKAEVRALALARLAPAPGRLIWDVGSGSGAVAVECARLGAAVVAVERRADDVERIRANAAAHGVDVRVVQGEAPAALADLPRPDAVFVGGGGPDVVAAVAGAPRVVVALAALDRLAPTRHALRDHRVEGVQLAASRLADLPDGTVRLAATNPIILLWGETT